MKKGVSVIIPAYDEEKNIADAVATAVRHTQGIVRNSEIIVVNDGSHDRTGIIADQLARKNKLLRVIHSRQNYGMGHAFRVGLAHAQMSYVTIFPGDNDTAGDSLTDLIRSRHDADIIISYTMNPQARSYIRRIISKTFVVFMNWLFVLNLRYFTGCFLCKTELIRRLPLVSDTNMFFAEPKIRLLKAGCSYKEVPSVHTKRVYGRSKAFSPKSFVDTVRSVYAIYKDVYLS